MIPVILDTDANNEPDDQHAIAYMSFNSEFFDIKGITVNDTYNGGGIQGHVDEATRVVDLCNFRDKVNIIPGTSESYYQIKEDLGNDDFDGREAVDFIIDKARSVYMAICLNLHDELSKNYPKLWQEASYELSGYWKIMNNIFYDDFESLNRLKEKFESDGFKMPRQLATASELYSGQVWKDPDDK